VKPLILLTFAVIAGIAQTHPDSASESPAKDIRLPNGKRLSEVVLAEEHRRALADAARLSELTTEFRADLEKDTRFVLSLQQLKRLDEIERLTRRLRGRLAK
jgi:UDP-N-acetylglucosamine 2-epimerase